MVDSADTGDAARKRHGRRVDTRCETDGYAMLTWIVAYVVLMILSLWMWALHRWANLVEGRLRKMEERVNRKAGRDEVKG